MNSPYPSTDTLAALAVQLVRPGAPPHATASEALKLWKACHAVLESDKQQGDTVLDARAFLAGFKDSSAIPLKDFLKAMFPKSKTTDTAKWYRDFLRDKIKLEQDSIASGKSESEIESEAAATMKRHREHGMTALEVLTTREPLANHRGVSEWSMKQQRAQDAASARHGKPA